MRTLRKYAVTSGLDRQVLLWDIDNREDMRRSKHETVICGLGWHPDGSSVAIADVDGRFGIWLKPIPSHMAKASVATGEEKAEELKDRQKLIKFDDNMSSASEDEDDDGDDEDDGADSERGGGKSASKKRRRRKAGLVNAVLPQDSFQPGVTPKEPGNRRRFLAYNTLGYISSRDDDSYFSIDMEFHDSMYVERVFTCMFTYSNRCLHPDDLRVNHSEDLKECLLGKKTCRSFGRRVQTLTDYYEYTMAALSIKGAVFACPYRGEEQPSVLFFKPFEAWAAKSEWFLEMPGNEEVGLTPFARADLHKTCLDDSHMCAEHLVYSANGTFSRASLFRSNVSQSAMSSWLLEHL